MENRDTRVVHTFFSFPRGSLLVFGATSLSTTFSSVRNVQARIVILGIWGWRRRGGNVLCWLDRQSSRGRYTGLLNFLCQGGFVDLRLLFHWRGLLSGGMCARRTRRNLHEFVESQYSWLAALPSFLPLVEDRWTGVVMALLFHVSKLLAAALANTFLRHGEGRIYYPMVGITKERKNEYRATQNTEM